MPEEMAQPPAIDFDYRGIDDVIHGRARLAIMAYLSGAGSADFNELKQRAAVADGNLSVHLRKLEEAGYIDVEKRFVGKKPQTLCRLNDKGRDAWIAYIDHIRTLLGGAD
ncbi:MAG TPA: transcriptional regulator [Allosphingosinicella sp.]|nr:transcriptional regulator [Allosphingosinicella sp.]